MERALVTGATGFIGSHLAAALARDGVEVHAIVRPTASPERLTSLREIATLHVDDATMDGVATIVERARPDACWHLATHFVASHQASDVPALAESNIAFGMRLAEAIAQSECRAFVNAGTVWQHVESEPYRPSSLYAATKQALEDVLRFYADRELFAVATLNLYDTYGPADPRPKLMGALTRAVVHDEQMMMSSGNQLIDLVHVDDAVDAFRDVANLLVAEARIGRSFAVSSGAAITLRELAARFDRVGGRALRVEWGARPDRPNEMLTHWDAGPPVPGWSPRRGLDAGIRELLAEERART